MQCIILRFILKLISYGLGMPIKLLFPLREDGVKQVKRRGIKKLPGMMMPAVGLAMPIATTFYTTAMAISTRAIWIHEEVEAEGVVAEFAAGEAATKIGL